MGLGKIISEAVSISPESALRLATYFGTGYGGAKLLLGMQADHDLWTTHAGLREALAGIVPVPHPGRPRS